jgi:hypothetical protein
MAALSADVRVPLFGESLPPIGSGFKETPISVPLGLIWKKQSDHIFEQARLTNVFGVHCGLAA